MRKFIDLVESETLIRDLDMKRFWWTENDGLSDEIEWPITHAEIFIEYIRDRNESLDSDDYDAWNELEKITSDVDVCIKTALSYGWVRISISKKNEGFVSAYNSKFAQDALNSLSEHFHLENIFLKIKNKEYNLESPNQIDTFLTTGRIVKKKINEAEVWDLGGAWITDAGDILPVDHRHGTHHSDIALDYFGEYIDTNDDDEYDEYSADTAQEIARDQGWIRISEKGNRSLSVEFTEASDAAKKALINYILKHDKQFMVYEIENLSGFNQTEDSRKFVGILRRAFKS